ncbi:hypothetical protein [Amphritea sp. HPY]|uniref:hypothetical protein n=1 Tax=Amphritea sp. HPY TaxID=3421652 RepID=UPI003D7E89A3
MRNFIVIALLAAIGITGFYMYQKTASKSLATEETQQTTVLPADELSKIAARKHIDSLTPEPQQPIVIAEADHFVTDNQLLKIPTPQSGIDAVTQAVQSGDTKSFAVELKSFGEKSASGGDLIIHSDNMPAADQIRLQELLNDPDNTAGKLFYIHGVTHNDRQGLWGIIQSGLIKTFASGLELKQNRISAEIPQSADERLNNSTSSFLGSILDHKVKDTYVYNYKKGILGQNPDLITPGQELIIVTFTEAELVEIYNHFATE